jgi:prepilin-type N-terminal cleavage/methylation domain-containing protein
MWPIWKRFSTRSMRAEKGFTLLEVIIAIALLGVVAVAILSGLSTGSRAILVADERATAESLARSQMEYVKSLDYTKAPSGGEASYTNAKLAVPSGYEIRSINRAGAEDASANIIAVPWNSATGQPAANDTGLQRIKLAIYHLRHLGDSNPTLVLTLEGYKVQL